MKRLFALMLCAVSLVVGATAPEGYCISIEEYAVHDAGELAGLTTYRVYLNCANETDFLLACGGDVDNPLIVNSTSGTWYNNGLNASWNASGLSPAFFSFFPDLQYDSFVTIGNDNSIGSEPSISVGGIDWRQEFLGSGTSEDATYGSSFTVNDEAGSAWFMTFPGLAAAETHPAFAGDDLRVLVMQITTAGTLFGQIYCQVFVEGSQASELRALIPLGGCDCDGIIDPCGVCSGSGVAGCLDPLACNNDPGATCDDGSCDYSCYGCTISQACNYDTDATVNDGSCDFESCLGLGCTDSAACNYDPEAVINDGSCVYILEGECDCDGNVVDAIGVCGGECIEDENGNGICDGQEVYGCLDMAACNYNDEANVDNPQNCFYAEQYYDCLGNCLNDVNGNGVCDELDISGCLDPEGCNYNDEATVDAPQNCVYAEQYYNCDGLCLNDVDQDSICDELEIPGCSDVSACNYEVMATDEDGSCSYPDALGVCGGDCGSDADADGICDDVDPCVGELDECGVCNGTGAIYDCGCVDIPQGFCDCDLNQLDALGVCGGDCAEDANSDGICDDLVDCTNIGAAFWQDLELGVYISAEQSPVIYDSLTVDGIQLTVGEDFTNELILNVPLVFVDEVTGGAFQVLSWSNLTVEGLPPGVKLILPPALDGASQACVELTGDDYPTQEGYYEVVITGEVLLNFFGTAISIGDVSSSFWVEVVSNPNGVPGCTYPTASNYMPWATYDSGVCEYAGCTDPSALNYSPRHSIDDGSCFYNDPNCVADAACPEDLNGDGAVGTPDLLLMLGEYGNFCD
ncbi:hypothetical protein N9V29_04645 [Flavobacteriales bacterium]|nr:hypothetical protein [Flavobacteriales bacterium]